MINSCAWISMKKNINILCFVINLLVGFIQGGDNIGFADIDSCFPDYTTSEPPIITYEYTKPVGNKNYLFQLPHELIQEIVLRAGYSGGNNFLLTCKLLHNTPYILDCPAAAIVVVHNSKDSNILQLLSSHRLVNYNNSLKCEVMPELKLITELYFWPLKEEQSCINELYVENKNNLFLISTLSKYVNTSSSIKKLITHSLISKHAYYNARKIHSKRLKFVTTFSKNESITHLGLCGSYIHSNGGQLVTSIMMHKNLTNLNLDNTYIQRDDVVALARNIKGNTVLILLSLKNNQLGVDAQNAQLLSNALKENTRLVKLYLDNNGFQYNDAVEFAKCLTINTTLKKLSLCNNSIGMGGVFIFNCLRPRVKTSGAGGIIYNYIIDPAVVFIASGIGFSYVMGAYF